MVLILISKFILFLIKFLASYKAIYLNGEVMLNKWIREIYSSNPKKIKKLIWASSIIG